MPLKIIATSDLHLGMKLSLFEEIQKELSETRYLTFEKIVKIANLEKADLLILSGDLFEKLNVPKNEIDRACDIINNFKGKVTVILPGKHDYLNLVHSQLWDSVENRLTNQVIILREKKVESLSDYGINANIYPSPCNERISSNNSINWIRDITKDKEIKYHIGVAYGSVEDYNFEDNDAYNPIRIKDLETLGLDLWIIGHLHNQHQINNVFIPGTHESDGFKCEEEGRFWLIDINDSNEISSKSFSVGKYRFNKLEINFNIDSILEEDIQNSLETDFKNQILELELSGVLSIEEYKKLSNIDKIKSIIYENTNIFYLKGIINHVKENITVDTIEKVFTKNSFPYILLSRIAQEGNLDALQKAYDILMEAKS